MNHDEFNLVPRKRHRVRSVRPPRICCGLVARVRIRAIPINRGGRLLNVFFVCTGNICRSPMAEGVFAHFVKEAGLGDLIASDSAGTIDHHAGEPPDTRAQETALNHGIDIGHLRARQVCADDFERFHYVLAMDRENLYQLILARPIEFRGCLQLLCDSAPKRKGKDVPDPYYGKAKAFEKVFQLVSEASAGLLDTILREHYPQYAKGR